MVRIAIFASGGGSNAKEIIKHFAGNTKIKVALIVSNKSDAGVLRIAQHFGIQSKVFKKSEFIECEKILGFLADKKIAYIILAGFLLHIPDCFTKAFEKRIINIHPSLLPKYGGKGMYGHFVHEAVKKNNEKETGITIHLVNEQFDEGEILFQKSCNIREDMDADEIAALVLKLEHQYFSTTIENYILGSCKVILKSTE